LKYNQHFPAPK